MKPHLHRNLLLLGLFLVAVWAAAWLKPQRYLADTLPELVLEQVVPTRVGAWQMATNQAVRLVNPQQTAVLNTLYTQVLERVYVNPEGYHIMLSMAYGRDQRDSLQAHKPEVCYPAQGFQLLSDRWVVLAPDTLNVPAKQLVTQLQQRTEPVTYWHVVGQQVVQSGVHKKLTEMAYAAQGLVPDGTLVRVSSIDPDRTRAHLLQEAFLQDMVQALPAPFRPRLGGAPTVSENPERKNP